MRNKILYLTVCVGMAAMLTTAHAETWSCDYDGQWSTFNSNDQGPFNWKVMWQSTPNGGWAITGNYSDRYGESVLDGTCNSNTCQIHQTYQRGELQGKHYYWVGKYQDQVKDDITTSNSFKGTWGYTPQAKDGGNWNAMAICVRR